LPRNNRRLRSSAQSEPVTSDGATPGLTVDPLTARLTGTDGAGGSAGGGRGEPPAARKVEAAPGTARHDGYLPFRGLLRIPLFYKILLANAGIIMVGAVIGTLATMRFLRTEPGHSPAEIVVPLALVGVGVTMLVNALILRLALGPLNQLEETAALVQAGNLDARAPLSPLADRELERLTRTFNAMLDNLATYRKRTRDVAARALHAEEEERKRIARELHDETAQSLAALLIRLRLARGIDDPAARSALLDELRQEIGAALEGIRRFARGLRPPALDELGLVPAIESHANNLIETVGLNVRIEAEALDHVLTPQAELALYRIVQEALSNVIRHSGARSATVGIRCEADAVVVDVEDDGRGFSPDAVMSTNGSGLGLFGMQERAEYLGGRVSIESRPGSGTRVRAEIPILDATSNG
jgi:two-component system, NarL family, sensor histidine kinase UhpB